MTQEEIMMVNTGAGQVVDVGEHDVGELGDYLILRDARALRSLGYVGSARPSRAPWRRRCG